MDKETIGIVSEVAQRNPTLTALSVLISGVTAWRIWPPIMKWLRGWWRAKQTSYPARPRLALTEASGGANLDQQWSYTGAILMNYFPEPLAVARGAVVVTLLDKSTEAWLVKEPRTASDFRNETEKMQRSLTLPCGWHAPIPIVMHRADSERLFEPTWPEPTIPLEMPIEKPIPVTVRVFVNDRKKLTRSGELVYTPSRTDKPVVTISLYLTRWERIRKWFGFYG